MGGAGGKGGGPPGGIPSGGEVLQGPSTPSKLLEGSSFMRWGQEEMPEAAAVRGVKALKHLATASSEARPPTQAPADAQEDPLVGDVLGSGPGCAASAPGAGTIAHHGFVCDVTGAEPIMGVRFKATSAFDLDITEACRRAGRFAGGAGFKPVHSPEWAMRCALSAVLRWWPLLWPGRGDVFDCVAPDLESLGMAALC